MAAENESSGGLVPVERLMVAIARHWRLAEVQFEDAVRKVRSNTAGYRYAVGLLVVDFFRKGY